MHTHTHIEVNILLCLCCCLNTKSWPPPPPSPPALNPEPPAASRGGETQTRTRRALSAPQPLNTFSALPFENKPHGQAPLSQTPSPHASNTCLALCWELGGELPPAAVPRSRCENGGGRACGRFSWQRGRSGGGEARRETSPQTSDSCRKITSNYFTRLTNKSLKPRLCNTRMINLNNSYDSNRGVEG